MKEEGRDVEGEGNERVQRVKYWVEERKGRGKCREHGKGGQGRERWERRKVEGRERRGEGI